MPTPPPSRPAVFRRSRVLIVGCGDVGLRVARLLAGRLRVIALSSQPARRPALRAAGLRPLLGNLDDPSSLGRLAGLAPRLLHLAPPPGQGADDPRTAALLRALGRRGGLHTAVYGSTTGVYGDAGGAFFDETRPLRPASDRARRRVAAEQRLRDWSRQQGVALARLRIPGIYALDREGGDPRERVARGSPVLQRQDDVHTNHIHADDLARACLRALFLGRKPRALHISDDGQLPMGDHFDAVAERCGLPRPPRLSRAEAQARLSPMTMSFLSESRRLDNGRMKRELRLKLRYPTVLDALPPAAGG